MTTSKRYQNDFSESSFDRSAFKQQNSVEAAFGKIPKGGFIKSAGKTLRFLSNFRVRLVLAQKEETGPGVRLTQCPAMNLLSVFGQ